jgi:hypothetical protein
METTREQQTVNTPERSKQQLSRAAFRYVVCLTLLALGLPPLSRSDNSLAQPSVREKSCLGTLQVRPSTIHLGGTFTLRGSHFTCRSPHGTLFPSVGVIMYQPHVGFTVFTVHVRHNGTYYRTITMPRRLMAASVLTGGGTRRIAARPGIYYFAVSLFDVETPPPSQALAHVRVIQ